MFILSCGYFPGNNLNAIYIHIACVMLFKIYKHQMYIFGLT